MNRRDALGIVGSFALVAKPAAAHAVAYRFRKEPGKVRVLAGGRLFTTFHYGGEWDRPFLHPLVTPSGVELSRGVPPRPGEDSDHLWHRGLWWGHGDVNGVDFWRELRDPDTGRKTTGRIEVRKPPQLDAASATITARGELVAPDGALLGAVIERFRFSSAPKAHLIDVGIAIAAEGGQDLVMGDTDDGGLAVRLTSEFTEKNGATLLNSEGQQGTANLWGKAARWVDYSARCAGKAAGVAILDHPHNFRYPTRWHARGYGLNAANPFAAGSFKHPDTKDKNLLQDGQWLIRKGTQLAFRYRVVLHDGTAAEIGVASLHGTFAHLEARLR